MIDSIKQEALISFLKNARVPVIVSHPDGRIFWANKAFCEWSGYTVGELISLGWKRITTNETVETDLAASQALAEELTYEIQKQYIPKNDKPAWGTLSVMRWPSSGEIEFCVCTWEPLKNGTATAFALAVDHIEKFKRQLLDLTTSLNSLTAQTEEDRWVLSTMGIIRKYPKLTLSCIVVLLGIFGLNNTAELLERIHLIRKDPVGITIDKE